MKVTNTMAPHPSDVTASSARESGSPGPLSLLPPRSGDEPLASPRLDPLTTWVPTARLVLNPESVRDNDAAVPHLVESIKKFGLVVPIVVKRSMQVISGNARIKAARILGLPEMLVRWFDGSDADAAAYAITDNRVRDFSTWNEQALADLLAKLKVEDEGLPPGYTDEDLAALLAKLKAEAKGLGEDETPRVEPGPSATRVGDIWMLGDHRLLCGDSTNPDDVARVLGGDRVALLATDPPYAVDYDGKNRPGKRNGRSGGKDWSAVYNETQITDYEAFMNLVFAATLPHLLPRAPIYVWHAHTQQPRLAAAFERHKLLLHQVLVWVKPSPAFSRSYFHWKHEVCAFGWKQGERPKHGSGEYSTVWEFDWEGKGRVVGNEHPTQKPTGLFELPMKLHTQPGAVVLEPFSGSGTQIVAAEKLGRHCRALEIQPAFVDVAIRRWEKLTNQRAVLSSDGRAFGDIAEERRAA